MSLMIQLFLSKSPFSSVFAVAFLFNSCNILLGYKTSHIFHVWAHHYLRSKLSFVEAETACFSQCYCFLFIATVFINTVFYKGAEEEEEGSGWNINRAQQRATPSTHRRPLLFLFPFSFSFLFVFSFVFCILHCSREM